MRPSTDKYLPWFILREIPGLNNRACKQLLLKFNSPKAALDADPAQLSEIKGISPKAVHGMAHQNKYKVQARTRLAHVLAAGYKITRLTDSSYPALLKEIPDPPLLLIYDGNLDGSAPCVSIVGSRKPTRYGVDTAKHLAGRLSEKGFTVVSGMAIGIDTAAHTGALNSSGTTLAVLGSGLRHIYPRQNKGLYKKIRVKGAIVSEFNLDTPPLPAYFPQRNRIIAGMSAGTIVVEAAKRSGSLITARLSGEYNREVFAVPGSIRSSVSRGTHGLIRQGAKLVENENDIIEELGQFVHFEPSYPSSQEKKQGFKKAFPVMDKTQAMVYNLLDPYPTHIDQITSRAGLESQVTAAVLLDMELSGLILRHPGNYYSKSEE